jgi:putative hemolysin
MIAAAMGLLWLVCEQSVQGAAFGSLGVSPLAGSTWITLSAIFMVILLNGLFVASETAVAFLKPIHVKYVREGNGNQSGRLQALLDGRDRYVAACNIGALCTRIMLVLLALLLAPGLNAQLGWRPSMLLLAAIIVIVPVALVNLILGELVPKSFASLNPHRVGLVLFRFIQGVALLFSLPAMLVTSVAKVFTARFGGEASFVVANQAEEEIKTLVDSAQQTGEIEVDEQELLHSVFEFSDTVAREVMTPRVDIDAMPVKSDPAEVIKLIEDTGHSRIPLYEESDDQIVGIIHAKDLLLAMVNANGKVNLRALMRPAHFVPENKNLHELLSELRVNRSQMAVVQDEFGGTAGILTIEDIVEELVGDIVDEYDDEEPEIVASGDGYIVDGKTHLDDLNDEVGSEFESDEFDTIGGYVFGLFGRQPKPSEEIEDRGYRFTVAETDGRRIVRLHVAKASVQETAKESELVE